MVACALRRRSLEADDLGVLKRRARTAGQANRDPETVELFPAACVKQSRATEDESPQVKKCIN